MSDTWQHSLDEPATLDDWISVPQDHVRESCHEAESATSIEYVNSLPTRVRVGTLLESDRRKPSSEELGCEAVLRGSEGLPHKIHFARARAREARQEHLDAQEWLARVEKEVRGQQDETAANCCCSQCADHLQLDDDSKSDHSDASSNVPPLVEEYFEFAREAFLSEERLSELDLEYKRAEVLREASRAESHTSDLAPHDTETLYRRERTELAVALAVAHYRLNVRRNACLAQGMDPERFRYRHDSDFAEASLGL